MRLSGLVSPEQRSTTTFERKDELVQAVDSYLIQLIMERQLQDPSLVAATPQEQLHAHLDGIQQLLVHDPSIFIALQELNVQSLRDPAVKEILARADQGWHDYLTWLLQAGVRAGEFRDDLEPASAAWVMLSFIKGLDIRMPAQKMAAVIRELEGWVRSRSEV